MASLQIINRRIRSVRSTRQITKAMQLVAASKLRRAQQAALGPQAFAQAAREFLARLSGQTVVKRHPLMQARPVKRVLYIVIAGDRGMAGGYNSNILRALGRSVRERGLSGKVRIQTKQERGLAMEQSGSANIAIGIGKRVSMGLARAKDVSQIEAYDCDVEDTAHQIVLPALDRVFKLYEENQIDAVDLVSTDFVSTVTQRVNVRQLLPVVVPPDTKSSGDAEMEPEPDDLVDFAIRRVLEAQLTQAILEARASEQAARMLAMMNATDNASDIIDDLTLLYNNERQSSITQEISEISAGAEAISGA